MATQLTVTNDALRILGEPELASPNVNTEAARQMLAVYTDSINIVLEQADWNFARRRVQLSLSQSTPGFGYSNYFAMPADWLRIINISATGEENDSVVNYQLENGLIACDEETAYLYYVTSTAVTNTGSWPPMFAKWVAAEMAQATAPRLNPSAIEVAQKAAILWQRMAKSSDQINQPPRLRRPGAWATARRAGFQSSSEQG